VLSQAQSLRSFVLLSTFFNLFMDFGLLGLSEVIIVWSHDHPSKARGDQDLSLSIAM
jgi:hypothetical protein